MRHLLLLPLLLSAIASHAEAQAELLLPGQYVRVTSVPQQLRGQVGTILRLHNDTMILRRTVRRVDQHGRLTTDSTDTTVPISSVSKLEILVGQRSNVDRGVRKGAMIGAGFGLVIGLAAAADDSGYLCGGGGAECVLQGTFGGALWGVIIGLVVGASSSRDEWLEIRTRGGSEPVKVGLTTGGGGFGIGASITF